MLRFATFRPMRRWSPLLLLLAACASGTDAVRPAVSATSANGSASLYQRLGGRPAIEAVMHTFVANVGRDERVNVRFLFTDLDALQTHLTDQICAASGGPCTYSGRPMKALHAPLHIRAAEFDAMAEDLVAALRSHSVPERESKELLAIVASTRSDIVESSGQ
jgi:hemoglobin